MSSDMSKMQMEVLENPYNESAQTTQSEPSQVDNQTPQPTNQPQQQQVVEPQQPVTNAPEQTVLPQDKPTTEPVAAQPQSVEWWKVPAERLGLRDVADEQTFLTQLTEAQQAKARLSQLEPDLKLAQLVKENKYDEYRQVSQFFNQEGQVTNPIELAKVKFIKDQQAALGKTLSSSQAEVLWSKHLEKVYDGIDVSEGEPEMETDYDSWYNWNRFQMELVEPAKKWAAERKAEIESSITTPDPKALDQKFQQEFMQYYDAASKALGNAVTVKIDEQTELSFDVVAGEELAKAIDPWAITDKLNLNNGALIPPVEMAKQVWLMNNLDKVISEAYQKGRLAERQAVVTAGRNPGQPNVVIGGNEPNGSNWSKFQVLGWGDRPPQS